MIRISHRNVETPIILETNNPMILSIENPNEFYRFTEELRKAFNGEESEFSFWINNDAFIPDKRGEILLSPFYFETSDKKIMSLLYKKLQKNFHDGDFLIEFNEINGKIEKFLLDLCSTVDFSVDYETLSIENILKTSCVKPTQEYDGLLEKIVNYVNIFCELKHIDFFVFVGITDVLSEIELLKLYKHCELQKVNLLILEHGKNKRTIENERKIIITEDLCELVENIEEIY